MNREKFIENLKSARESRGLTQKQIAEALGISDRTCSKWETGETEPGIELICRLAELCGLSPADFFREETPQEGSPVRSEFRTLPVSRALPRLRDIIDEAFDGQADSALELNKRMIEGDEEAKRLWMEPVPPEKAPEDFPCAHIGSPDNCSFLIRCWDKELNLRLLMLPAEAGIAGLLEGAEELGELFTLLRSARLLLPLMEAEKDRRWYDYFTPAHLAEGTGLTAEEADETLKAMQLWGFCTRQEVETGAGDHWLYACGSTELLRAILALARLLVRDMRERRDGWAKRGETV